MSGVEENLSLYIRRFSTKKVVKEEVGIFAYFPKPMKHALYLALNSDRIKREHYILGPLEEKRFQIGVTGKATEMEAIDRACARELGEEIGLVPRHLYDLVSYGKEELGREKIMWSYGLNISKATPVLDHQQGVYISDTKDTKNQKIGCLVSGSKEDLLKFLSRQNIYLYASQDKVIGVGMISVKDIFELLKKGKIH